MSGYGRMRREQHKRALEDIPLSSRVELIALISKHIQKLDYALDHDRLPFREYQQSLNTLDRLVARIDKLSASPNEAGMADIVNSLQLSAVLEILMIAIKTNDAFAQNRAELIAVLENLTIEIDTTNDTKALQPSEAAE